MKKINCRSFAISTKITVASSLQKIPLSCYGGSFVMEHVWGTSALCITYVFKYFKGNGF
jgi:hypothetical protein